MRENDQRSRWTLEQLVELEVALYQDESESTEALEKRDRSIGERAAQANIPASDRRSRLAFWLGAVRPPAPADELPVHQLYLKSLTFAARALAIIAALSGAGLATQLLRYEGSEPVNVSAFSGLLILLQAALAAATLILVALPLKAGKSLQLTIGFQLLRPVWKILGQIASHASSRLLDGERRQTLLALAGRTRGGLFLYESITRWTLFRAAQTIGASFNLGALVAFALAVAFSDLAFGWQTSLSLGPEQISSLVRAFAAPWSWLWGEGVGYPALADIEGSRIVLKDGIRSLNSAHLGSWWPFLGLGVVVYGLLPRLLLRAWAGWRMSAALDRLDFKQARVQRVLDRMETQDVAFASSGNQPSTTEAARSSLKELTGSRPPAETLAILLSPDLRVRVSDSQLLNALKSQSAEPRFIELTNEDLSNPGASATFANLDADEIAIVFEAWMPPIAETKRLLRSLRAALAPKIPIRALLLGKPSGPGGFSAPDESAVALWNRTLDQLGDPYCSAAPLAPISAP